MRPDEAGAATAPEAAPAAPETPAAPAEQQSGVTLDRILSRVDELGSQVGEFAQRLPEPEQEPEPDQVEQILQQLGYEMPEEEEVEEPDQGVDLRQLVELLTKAQSEALRSELAPLQTQMQDQRLEAAFTDLETKYPKLVEDEDWQNKVLDTAEALAQRAGSQELIENPTFLELVHKSLLADERAEQETPVDTAHRDGLEAPNGANPGATEPDVNEAQEIVQASGNKKLRDAGLI